MSLFSRSLAACVLVLALSGWTANTFAAAPCYCDPVETYAPRVCYGVWTPLGYFPAPRWKVFQYTEPEYVPADRRVGLVEDPEAYREYYGKPRKMSRSAVRRMRNEAWALHTELKEARASIKESYGVNDSPAMAGYRVAPRAAGVPYSHAGPRAYANAPEYHGAPYTASFQVDQPAGYTTEAGRKAPPQAGLTNRSVVPKSDTFLSPDASPDRN